MSSCCDLLIRECFCLVLWSLAPYSWTLVQSNCSGNSVTSFHLCFFFVGAYVFLSCSTLLALSSWKIIKADFVQIWIIWPESQGMLWWCCHLQLEKIKKWLQNCCLKHDLWKSKDGKLLNNNSGHTIKKSMGAFRKSNLGPLAPKARIIPLDQMPNCWNN